MSALELAAKAYWLAVDAHCDNVRRNMLIPFCERHGLQFVSGMGVWFFVRKYKTARPDRHFGEANMPALAGGARLLRVLAEETVDGHPLALELQDYKPREK